MQQSIKYRGVLLVLFFAVIFTAFLNLSLGSVNIPFRAILNSILQQEIGNESWNYIILEYRLPKVFTAILTGSGLAVSGLLMQNLFQNPLAGPYVLGLSSGASLGVAIVLMGASLFGGVAAAVLLSKWSLVIAASAGSLIVLVAVLLAAKRLRDTMAILIIGLMFASLTAAVVSVLAYFSPAQNLQQYVFWSFGSLGTLAWKEVGVLSIFWFTGIILSIYRIKNLNTLLLGEQYARSLGVDIKTNRYIIISATSLMAGSVTAFAGPIAFVGLAVPHLVRQLIPVNDHRVLLPAVIMGGAILMLVCDIAAQLPGSEYTLPINAITSLVGAPVVIWLLVRKRNFIF